MRNKSVGTSKSQALALGALGVVYGDIGTSPLYALRECFSGSHAVPATHSNVYGIVSLILWTITLLVSVKYVSLVMRATNKGEGGILSLLSLAVQEQKARTRAVLLMIGVFGAALLFGDGMLTPAVTVLSALEGLEVATPTLKPYIIPMAVGILVALFAFQSTGTGKVARIFGPITLTWFLAIAVLGGKQIVAAPEILKAFNPLWALEFLLHHGVVAFLVLGAVFLAVTGAEALYADMGHFGARPIKVAWFYVVFPALAINYLGQGALLLHEPASGVNPFYKLCPSWSLYPVVALATAASVIASQALITGAYSLAMQAIQLGYFPRLEIRHTSSEQRGQIYLPQVNWALMFACIGLVVGFKSSTNLAAAYGIAVSLTMLITTLLLFYAARSIWGWSMAKALVVCGFFFVIEAAFSASNLLKFTHGGWFPLVIGAVFYTVMTTWKTGRAILRTRLEASSIPVEMFLEDVKTSGIQRVAGTAVFLAGNPRGTPVALLHNVKHNRVLHERVILLTVLIEESPHVGDEEKVSIQPMAAGFHRVIGKCGFMEEPNVPEILRACAEKGLGLDPMKTTYFLSRENIIPTRKQGMALWREKLFGVMARNAHQATAFFQLPPDRVVELGMQVEM